MDYISTRGKTPPKSFCKILLEGLAPDGGLYMPRVYPYIDKKELFSWKDLSYRELAFKILSLYIDDIPANDLQDIINRTYTKDIFGTDEITPIKMLSYPGFFLQQLSNGPTLAFKDVALQLLGNLFEYELGRQGEELNILGATSGDTGSAAEYAMLAKKGIRVFMLSPNGRMSPFQQAQMYSLNNSSIFNIAVNGVFDDCQDIVKAISRDAEFKNKYKIGTVNSINWARILAQVVYYFYGYFQVLKNSNNPHRINFSVPTGNFGNICAGHVARMMGLPIECLLLATNENDVLDEFFQAGHYRIRKSTFETSSPSMDISKASNFERFIFDLLDRDSERVRELFSQPDGFKLKEEELAHIKDFGFISGKSSHSDRLDTITFVWRVYNYIIDPHTADAVKIAYAFYKKHIVSVIVFETAKASKFVDTIYEAISVEPERPNKLEGIESLPKYFTRMDPDVNLVKEFIKNHC